jgi:protein tyrosine phosphatase domain-containing protein 1
MSKPVCLFCNGRFCKYENYERWLDVPNCHPAIRGLYSNWITDQVIAMARPSERAIQEHNIIAQFKRFVLAAGLWFLDF